MQDSRRRFLPAAGRDWLLPLYDPFQRLMRGEAAHRQLLEQAELRPGLRVLDLGCGTGTLAVLLQRLHPQVEFVGIDPDPKALARARRKAELANAKVRFEQGYADALPFPDASFDRVLSSFVFHHLDREVKTAAFREARRVLAPGGSLHLLDFGGAHAHGMGLLAVFFHRSEQLRDNLGEGLPDLMRAAGFSEAAEVGARRSLLGKIGYFAAH